MLPKANPTLKFNIYALFFVAGFLDAEIQTWVRFHICDTVLKTGISTFVFRSGLSRKILLVFTGFQTFKVTEIVKKKKRGGAWSGFEYRTVSFEKLICRCGQMFGEVGFHCLKSISNHK